MAMFEPPRIRGQLGAREPALGHGRQAANARRRASPLP
jgi:hypothetical protein